MKKLTAGTREALKKPFGRLLGTGEMVLEAGRAKKAGRMLVSVGDSCTFAMISAGVSPDIVVYDELCRRLPTGDDVRRALSAFDGQYVRVKNPAGHITDELLAAVAAAVAEGKGKILVDGEEDLAALPAMMDAPDGAIVVYGQPEEGAVLVEVDKAVKEKAAKIFSEMEDG